MKTKIKFNDILGMLERDEMKEVVGGSGESYSAGGTAGYTSGTALGGGFTGNGFGGSAYQYSSSYGSGYGSGTGSTSSGSGSTNTSGMNSSQIANYNYYASLYGTSAQGSTSGANTLGVSGAYYGIYNPNAIPLNNVTVINAYQNPAMNGYNPFSQYNTFDPNNMNNSVYGSNNGGSGGISEGPKFGKFNNVSSVIPKNKFIGWSTPGVRENCFDYAWKQLKDAGFTMKSPGWGTDTKKNDFIYQTYLEKDVAGMKAGVQKNQFTNGVNYLVNSLKSGIPVIVGVDDASGTPGNTDKTTDHFVVIVGMGNDSKGNYFTFFDNATKNNADGTSSANKLYVNENTMKISGTSNNDYAMNSQYGGYTITQIRETKKN